MIQMKQSNLITLLFLFILIGGVSLFMLFRKTEAASPDPTGETTKEIAVTTASEFTETTGSETESINAGAPDNESTPVETESVKTEPVETEPVETEPVETETAIVSTDKSLFIGDSRTVGLMEYGQIDGADFFCSVGMSVFNIHKKPVSVPSVGKLTLTELLDHKKYNEIYIMLGVNEMGYNFESIIEKYNELITFVKEKEPEAAIIILANLHVTKKRSDTDKTFNNTAINRLNAALSEFADFQSIFYLDGNALFDDETGALSPDRSSDNTHLYAKYYTEWGNWIRTQTASLIREE